MIARSLRHHRARRARRRFHRAEQRFFDAYGRGGTRARCELVIPIDYFARVDVVHVFHAWLSGRARVLDVTALERAWMECGRGGGARADAAVFYRNLAHFLSLL